MFVAREIPAEHKDLIHDVSYDYHGRRMATCSSDQSVKVWDLGEDGQWHCTASWKTHSGSVWKVTWAHPEFGQVLASCSFDRTAAVWEEQGKLQLLVDRNQLQGWSDNIPCTLVTLILLLVKRSSLVDSRTSVTDVKFAPKHLGLQLATCSKDGTVRIYEAPDIMNLGQWQLQNEIHHKLSCSCVSWNLSRVHPPMLAVGSNDPNTSAGGKVQIHEHNEANRKWHRLETLMAITDAVHDVAFAPNLGRSYHLLAIASKDVRIMMLKPYREQGTGAGASLAKLDISLAAQFNDHDSQVWRVEWNITGTILASSGDDGCVRLWKANYLNNWKCITVLRGDGTSGPISGPSMSGSIMNGQDPKTSPAAFKSQTSWYT